MTETKARETEPEEIQMYNIVIITNDAVYIQYISERLRGEVLTTRRYTNLRLFTFTFTFTYMGVARGVLLRIPESPNLKIWKALSKRELGQRGNYTQIVLT